MEKFKQIDIDSAFSKIDKGEFVIIDIRDSESFNLGHIDGAINLSNSNISDFTSNTEKNKNILVYCYHGNSSKSVAEFLASHNFNNVYSLDGGYEAWKIKENQ